MPFSASSYTDGLRREKLREFLCILKALRAGFCLLFVLRAEETHVELEFLTNCVSPCMCRQTCLYRLAMYPHTKEHVIPH